MPISGISREALMDGCSAITILPIEAIQKSGNAAGQPLHEGFRTFVEVLSASRSYLSKLTEERFHLVTACVVDSPRFLLMRVIVFVAGRLHGY